MTQKNLFIITSNFPPTNIVGALRPFRLAKHIGKNGWKVYVVTFSPKNLAIENFTLLNELPSDTEICNINTCKSQPEFVKLDDIPQFIEKHKSHSNYTPSRKRPPFIKRAFLALTFRLKRLIYIDESMSWAKPIVKAVESKLNTNETNVVFTTSPPHSLHLTGYILKKRYNTISWVADFRDPWDIYTPDGQYKLNHWVSRILEPKVMKSADAVISTTATNTRHLIERYSTVDKNKFHTITNTYDKDLVNVDGIKSKENFVISYTGIFYVNFDPYAFFRALRTWLDKMDEVKYENYGKRLKIQIIGYIDNFTKKTITDLKLLDVVTCINQVAHAEAIQYLRNSDMALMVTGLNKTTRPGWVLSKLSEYLGCRIPILAVIGEGEMSTIIRDTNSGYIINTEDHDAIGEILDKEISRKFYPGSESEKTPHFTFEGVESFEETKVIKNMIAIIEDTTKN